MQLREYLPYDVKQVMRTLPADGIIRNKIRQFTLNPQVSGRARSVKALAVDLGFDVVECDLPEGVNGRLVADTWSASGWRIEVNERLSVEAKRFAVLHELGHYFRHPQNDDPLSETKHFALGEGAFYVDRQEEREANEFAEALLFGAGQLAAASTLLGGDLKQLAHYFGVTQRVVEIGMAKLLAGS